MQNGCDDRIAAYCLGFADKVGATMLHSPKMGVGGTGHAVHDATDAKGRAFDAVFKQGILSFTLDGFISTFGAPVPNHIKIDVDGIEAKIIDGAPVTLARPEVRTVLVETNDQRGFQYIDGKLRAAGFELVARGKDNKIYARTGTAAA
jgi:FkbM family methyltransferase